MANLDRLRDLLAQLDDHLSRQQVPLADSWQPGISADQAQTTATAELGFALPAELVEWFAWHDGIDPHHRGQRGYWLVGSSLLPLSLAGCIEAYRQRRWVASEVARTDPLFAPDQLWPPRWLPWLAHLNPDLLVVDTAVPDGADAPVHVFYSHDALSSSLPVVCPSVTDAVAAWVWMFDTGRYRYDPVTRHWLSDRDALDAHIPRQLV
jgi:cell wall assembly regulator SMI1